MLSIMHRIHKAKITFMIKSSKIKFLQILLEVLKISFLGFNCLRVRFLRKCLEIIKQIK